MADEIEPSHETPGSAAVPAKPLRFPRSSLILLAAGLVWLASEGYGLASGAVVGGLAAVFAWYAYVDAPIRLRRSYWMSPDPLVRAVDLDAPETATGLAEGHRGVAHSLGPLGFDDRGAYAFEGMGSNGDATIGFFEDRAGCTTARWAWFVGTRPPLDPVLVFSTKFADGTEVLTGNTRTAPIVGASKHRRAFPFPGVDDPARLLALHRRALVEGGEAGWPTGG